MANANVDTPDNQRGTVNAQLLLATVPAATLTATVTPPINTETLVVVLPISAPATFVSVEGTTSLVTYPGARVRLSRYTGGNATYYIDVSTALDTSFRVSLNTAPGGVWQVYSDAGVHIVVDPTKSINDQGAQYVIPTVPNPAQGDAPLNELSAYSNWGVASGTNILPVPLGQRYRIFYAQVAPENAGAIAGLADSVTANNFVLAGIGAAGIPGTAFFYPSGLPLSTGAAVTVGTTAGNATINLTYTQETP